MMWKKELTIEKAQQAIYGRPAKLQLDKITDFGKCRNMQNGHPPHSFEKRIFKINI